MHISEFRQLPRTRVILAHDEPWYNWYKKNIGLFHGRVYVLQDRSHLRRVGP
ncbi:hypothetical protein C8R41DRAFT_832688 [Lentinula lateritia]|uniref:Uncharacterized protein n=1 Tax=Lentinula lateritia TaxID=40482 RepID=A0ABQ8VHP2_9AGAR|nr:hypothetical protein C8R41DRAFT_832688 [Lentinula lateritia]